MAQSKQAKPNPLRFIPSMRDLNDQDPVEDGTTPWVNA